MFKKGKRTFVAYRDQHGTNEFLVRDGKKYFVVTNQKKIFPVTATEAHRTLQLIKSNVLEFRGIGSFKQKLKDQKKGANK